jgi:hypothetical protein
MGQADILSVVKIGSTVIRAAVGLEIVGLNQVLRGEMAVVAGYAAHGGIVPFFIDTIQISNIFSNN